MQRSAYLLLVGILSFASATFAQGPSSSRDAFAAGTAAFAEEDYLRALAHFEAARDAGMDGPAVHYNIAVSHYKLGNYARAGTTFSLIAERYPAMRALAEYNLGLVALRQGDTEQAKTHFRRALEDSEDEKIKALARRQLDAGPTAIATPKRWYNVLNLRIGHDDNVRLLSDELSLSAGDSADSRSTEFMAVVSGPISFGRGLRFDGSLYTIRYQDAPFFDQDYLRLGLAYQWRWGDWALEAGPHLSYATLDGDSYEDRAGVGVRLRRDLSPRLRFGIRYLHDEVNEGAERFAFVEGARESLELRLVRRDARGRLTARLAVESNDRGSTIANARRKLSLAYRLTFSERWAAGIEGSYRRSDYEHASTPRDEDLATLSIDVTRSFARDWALTGEFAIADNSTVAPYSYDRTRFSLAVAKAFD